MIWPRFKSRIPRSPGVYIYKDKNGKILYVGKAIDLYHRVSSYFKTSHLPVRQKILIDQIADLETIIVESELEALILEANLIKKYLPLFNVRLTDDKDYLYIAVSKEAFPKIITARKKDLQLVKNYWGPFPSSRTVKFTLRLLRRVFPWCSNLQSTRGLSDQRIVKSFPIGRSSIRDWKLRACFYYHLGLCPGACMGLISRNDYNKIINRFSKFMDGKKEALVSELVKEMGQESKAMRFENAARIKKILDGITYLTQPNRTKLYLENPNFLEEENQFALEELKKDLSLKKLPERIEGYDISNIQGMQATGSMVVLTHGEIDKSQYRKFKIKIAGKPNDVGMMKEIIERRFKHREWPMPDLIIVDGGRGQARAVKLGIPIFGLAKRMEWLYPPEGEALKLPRKSLSLKLLQKLRDEAHRFAISYHKKLRSRAILGY